MCNQHKRSEEQVWQVHGAGADISPIGRSEAHALGALHRAVHILLLDLSGRLILSKRAEGREFNPGRWTSTASGHVTYPDSSRDAASREVEEETKLECLKLKLFGEDILATRSADRKKACVAWTDFYTSDSRVDVGTLKPQVEEVERFESFELDAVLAAFGTGNLTDRDGKPVVFADNLYPVVRAYWEYSRQPSGCCRRVS